MKPVKDFTFEYAVTKTGTLKAADLQDAETSARYLMKLFDGTWTKLLGVREVKADGAAEVFELPSAKHVCRPRPKPAVPRSLDDLDFPA